MLHKKVNTVADD